MCFRLSAQYPDISLLRDLACPTIVLTWSESEISGDNIIVAFVFIKKVIVLGLIYTILQHVFSLLQNVFKNIIFENPTNKNKC